MACAAPDNSETPEQLQLDGTDALDATRAAVESGVSGVIVGGALVLRAVIAHFGFRECLVSESDILDGLIASQRP